MCRIISNKRYRALRDYERSIYEASCRRDGEIENLKAKIKELEDILTAVKGDRDNLIAEVERYKEESYQRASLCKSIVHNSSF